jgi:hypothetical protein
MRKLLLFLFFINFFSKNIFCDDFTISHNPLAPPRPPKLYAKAGSDSEGIVSRGDDLRNFLDDGHEIRKNFSEKLKSTDGSVKTSVGTFLSKHNLSSVNYIHLAYLSHDEIFSELCERSSSEINCVKNSMEKLLEKIREDKEFRIQVADCRYHKIGNFEREKKRYGGKRILKRAKKILRKIRSKYKPALQVFAEHVYEKSCEAFEIVYEKECDEKIEIIQKNSDEIIENSLDLKENFSDNKVVVKMSDLSLTCVGCAIECARLKNFEAGFNFLGLAKCSSYVAKEFAKISLYVNKKAVEGLELGCKDIGLIFNDPKKYFSIDNFRYDEICKEISNFIALAKKDKLKAAGEIAKFSTRTFLNVAFWCAAYFYVLTPLATGLATTGSAIANLATEMFSAEVASIVGGAAAARSTSVISGVAEKVTSVIGAAAQAIPLITRAGQQIIESVLAFAAGDGSGGGEVDKVSYSHSNFPSSDSFDEIASYIKKHGKLPDNYITKEEAKRLGWKPSRGNLNEVAPGKSIGGNIFYNDPPILPDAPGRIWCEADIGYKSGYRGIKRILYSNDGLVYKTLDHYETFFEL